MYTYQKQLFRYAAQFVSSLLTSSLSVVKAIPPKRWQ